MILDFLVVMSYSTVVERSSLRGRRTNSGI